jgi:GPI ethanolamine phosphate transferase 2/3 subunit F
MAKKKGTTNVATNRSHVQAVNDDPLPLLKYFSLVVTQALLLLFSMAILPRTTLTFKDLPPQTSSLDRPQAAFMAPITAWPALTVAWMCVGTVFVQLYWGSKAAAWIEYDTLKETGAHKDDAKLREGDQSNRVSVVIV